MYLEPEQDRFFRLGTFVVIGLTFVFCLCYLILFVNPGIPLNPFKVQPTRAAVATLAPTWTPTATRTQTPTGTSVPTQPATDTPPATATLPPTKVPAILPTATRFFFPTPRPATRAPTAAPTPVPIQFAVTKNVGAPNCGTWYLSGTIWNVGGEPGGYGNTMPGITVRVFGNGHAYDAVSGATGKNSPGYWEVIAPQNHINFSGNVTVIDGAGRAISQAASFALTAGCNGDNAVNQVTIDFTKQ